MSETPLPQQKHSTIVKWIVQGCLINAAWWTSFGFLTSAPLWMQLVVISSIIIAVVVLLAEGN